MPIAFAALIWFADSKTTATRLDFESLLMQHGAEPGDGTPRNGPQRNKSIEIATLMEYFTAWRVHAARFNHQHGCTTGQVSDA